MAQAGYTPIQLYYSTTAAAVPLAANLAQGELAINITDGKLYYENNSGVVTLLASAAGASGDVVGPSSATDNALVRFDTTTGKLIQNSVGILSDAGILTGLTGITSSGSITFSSLTSGRVPYASTGGLLTDSANLTFNGTTLTANTIGAFTLSGTIAGGGNQINNVIIGTTTPLAGAFTTLSATGQITGRTSNGAVFVSSNGSDADFVLSLASALVTQNVTGSLQLQTGGSNRAVISSTGLAVTGTFSSTGGATIQGLTVGLGAGAVATNTVLGNNALSSNISGDVSVAIGYNALAANTSGNWNIAIGKDAMLANLTGSNNTVVGRALAVNQSGSDNTAIGQVALYYTTSSNNTAVGSNSLFVNDTGAGNTAVGASALKYNTASSSQTAIGNQALQNITGSFNGGNTALGQGAGYTQTSGYSNTYVGYNSGYSMISGIKNVILGSFNGNQSSLDIRNASNYIVLSDGDGNPRLVLNNAGNVGGWSDNTAFSWDSGGNERVGLLKKAGNGPVIASSSIWPIIFSQSDQSAIGVNIPTATVTERMRINSGAPVLCLAGGNTSATGTGIAFPTTQSASSDANTLDDYEEGTWTPVDNSGASITFDAAYGYYIKVGKVVYVQAKLVYPSTASGLNNSVGGLPFSMSNTNPYNFPVGATTANGNTSANRAYGFGSSFSFVNTADSISTNSALSSANINFNLTYIADQ